MAESIEVAASNAGVSRRTAKEMFGLLRGLLPSPAFRKWHQFEVVGAFNIPELPLITGEIWHYCYECYENRTCQRNYEHGNRKERQCRNCPLLKSEAVREFVDEDVFPKLYSLVDQTSLFYRTKLKIHKEDGYDPALLFKLRVYHSIIVWEAVSNCSKKTPEGAYLVDVQRPGDKTIHALWLDLLHELEKALAETYDCDE